MSDHDTDMPGEFDLITRYFGPLTVDAPEALGLLDDTALVAPPAGMEMAVTTDTLVAGVHFFDSDPPETVAAKLLAVNLSDLAAMGAKPHAYTFAAVWPRELNVGWIKKFADGLKAAQENGRIHLIGGDTVATPGPLSLSITAFGFVDTGRALRRNGASDGDTIFVSGTIGDAAIALRLLKADISADIGEADREFLVQRYRQPTPRNELGHQLVGWATSAIDVSDGLLADLGHISSASNVDIELNAEAIPLSPAVAKLLTSDPSFLDTVLTGGDDYELAFTVPPQARSEISRIAAKTGVEISEIGVVRRSETDTSRVSVLNDQGEEVTPRSQGYQHF